MAPGWLTILAWLSIAAGLVSAAAILYDIYWRGRRQPVRVMEAVWPITALYTGPLGRLTIGRVRLDVAQRRDPPARILEEALRRVIDRPWAQKGV
jgi:hypothetical protein